MEVKNKNYVTGIIGALIGWIIASIPWIICYVYFDLIWSLLAIPIALGALKGYQLLKGKEDKKLPIIISIVSIVVITLVTLVIIPLLLLVQEGLSANFTTLKLLYQYSDFKGAILLDYFLALVFTGLGISGTIANIKKQVNNTTNNNQTNPNSQQFVNNQMNNNQSQFVNNQMNNNQPQFVNNQMNNNQPQFINNQTNENNHLM